MYRSVIKVVLLCLLGAAAFMALRLYLIQPEAVAQHCVLYDTEFLCRVRTAAVHGFTRGLYGIIAVGAAALAVIGGLRYFALIAMLAGLAGVVLYDFDLSALGLLVGALVFARQDMEVREERQRKQQAPHTPV